MLQRGKHMNCNKKHAVARNISTYFFNTFQVSTKLVGSPAIELTYGALDHTTRQQREWKPCSSIASTIHMYPPPLPHRRNRQLRRPLATPGFGTLEIPDIAWISFKYYYSEPMRRHPCNIVLQTMQLMPPPPSPIYTWAVACGTVRGIKHTPREYAVAPL